MTTKPDEERQARPPDSEAQPSEASTLPEIDFSTFILSLSTSALYQMGCVPDPETGKLSPPDRTLAQHAIETLEMLRVKTQGNLDPEEEKLFASLLYELRMKFVEIRK
jgi:hypothetical protein